MRTKEDSRVIKTKRSLLQAFLELIKETSFDEMTINELCDKAEVRRATFYKHYKDKSDFLAKVVTQLITQYENREITNEAVATNPLAVHLGFSHRLIDFLFDIDEQVQSLLSPPSASTIIFICVEQNRRALIERLSRCADAGLKLIADVDSVALMIAGGVGAAIVDWILGGKKKTKDEMKATVDKLIAAMFVKE